MVPKQDVRADRGPAGAGRRCLGQLERLVQVYARLRGRHHDAEPTVRQSDASEWRILLCGRTRTLSGVQRGRGVRGRCAQLPGAAVQRLQPGAFARQVLRVVALHQQWYDNNLRNGLCFGIMFICIFVAWQTTSALCTARMRMTRDSISSVTLLRTVRRVGLARTTCASWAFVEYVNTFWIASNT